MRPSLTILVIVSFFLILGPSQVVLGQTGDLFKESEPATLSIFSTRTIPNLNLTQLIDLTVTKFGGSCPPEVAIYIHGWNKDQNGAGGGI